MGDSINRRRQKEYNKTPEERQVHNPWVGILKKAPVGESIHKCGADENPYSFTHVLRAVFRFPLPP